jgi:hypothetical protein
MNLDVKRSVCCLGNEGEDGKEGKDEKYGHVQLL